MMARGATSAFVLTAMLVAAACETLAGQDDRQALLTNPTPETRTELSNVVSEALNGIPVRLADDALTHDSVLIIEHVQPRDSAGLPLNGRELGKPEHFRLVKEGSDCILVHERTGKRWTLHSATCVTAAASK